MNTLPIKAAAAGSAKKSFYLLETDDDFRRYVTSMISKTGIQKFLTGFIGGASDDVLVKIRDLREENPFDYSGSVKKNELLKFLEKYKDFLFHDGYHDFMAMIPETNEYIVFDEHGLIFIYTEDDYSAVFDDFGIKYKPDERLIDEFDHWHCGIPGGQTKMFEMIKEMNLIME